MKKSREEKITEFLSKVAKIIENYPYISKDPSKFHSVIYTLLEDYGVPEYDRQKDVSSMFPVWINNFKSNTNIDVFVSPSWKYFCQFTNETADKQIGDICDPVKIYIPLDSNHLEEGVNKIFNFCSSNNIIHHSKVAKKIRSDNVVLRVSSLEDADKIIQFVANDPFFHSNQLKANPFAYHIGFMGLATDGNYSYNSQLANLIEKYMLDKQISGDLDKVSIEDFNQFIENSTQNKNLNLQEIDELIGCATNGKNELKDYVKHFKKVNEKFKSKARAIDFRYLDEAIVATICNHSVGQAVAALALYITRGDARGISRFNKIDKTNTNLRDELSKIEPNMIKEYLNGKVACINLEEQIYFYIEKEIMVRYSDYFDSLNSEQIVRR